MARIGWMKIDRGRAAAGHGRRNLLRDNSRLAGAQQDDGHQQLDQTLAGLAPAPLAPRPGLQTDHPVVPLVPWMSGAFATE